MARYKKSFGVIALAAAAAGAGLVGSGLIKDVKFAHARDNVEEARQQLAAADVGQLGAVYRNVGKVMEPSVVQIEVRKVAQTGRKSLPFDDDTLKKFFKDRNGDGLPDLPEGFGPGGGEDAPMESVGTGSGVIMEATGGSGFILTNNHVAGGASEITITLADGRVIENGKVLGTDPKTDLAVVEIKADRLIPARWGDSDTLLRGDFVLAFGSPFGYVGSMTHGIVSALNRQAGILADRQGYESFIQVDCPINPGNSGGPLTNLKGEVVGINTAIASRSGGFQGIGFAIPSNLAKNVYSQLKDHGKMVRGWLGVSISDVSKDVEKAHSFGYTGDKGVLVEQTLPDTPAYGHLKPGDIVTALDGKPVENVQKLRNTVAATKPNTELKMTVFRNGKNVDVPVKIAEQPDDLQAVAAGRKAGNKSETHEEAAAPAVHDLGFKLTDMTAGIRRQLNAEGTVAPKEGAVVLQVTPHTPAEKGGLRRGDVITQVNGVDVKNANQANEEITKANGKPVRLYVTDAIGAHFVLVKPAAKE
jgi:serine protease Do